VGTAARSELLAAVDCAVGSGEWAEPPHSPWTLRHRASKKAIFRPFSGARGSRFWGLTRGWGAPRAQKGLSLLGPPKRGPSTIQIAVVVAPSVAKPRRHLAGMEWATPGEAAGTLSIAVLPDPSLACRGVRCECSEHPRCRERKETVRSTNPLRPLGRVVR